jgi:hypothetical protein
MMGENSSVLVVLSSHPFSGRCGNSLVNGGPEYMLPARQFYEERGSPYLELIKAEI